MEKNSKDKRIEKALEVLQDGIEIMKSEISRLGKERQAVITWLENPENGVSIGAIQTLRKYYAQEIEYLRTSIDGAETAGMGIIRAGGLAEFLSEPDVPVEKRDPAFSREA